ncbi:hypothetical protein pb186bvf_001579 [Paramecium bursaria]
MIQSSNVNGFRGKMQKMKGFLKIDQQKESTPDRKTQTPQLREIPSPIISDGEADNICPEIQGREIGVNSRTFNQEYDLGHKLGEGSNGVVRQCWKKDQPNHILAVKIIQTQDEEMMRIIRTTFVNTLLIKSPYIAKNYKLFIDPFTIYLVMEYVPYGNLEKFLEQRGTLSEQQAQKIALGLFKAIRSLHTAGVAHRDIKPDNIQINPMYKLFKIISDCSIKLVDFGVSRRFVTLQNTQKYIIHKMLTVTGAIHYRAPEIYGSTYGYDQQVDIWSIGVVLYQALIGELPINSNYTNEIVEILSKKEPYTIHFEHPKFLSLSCSCRDFLKRILAWNPLQRLTASEALRHIWIPSSQSKKKKKVKDDIEMSKNSQGSIEINKQIVNSAMMLNQELQNTLILSKQCDSIQEDSTGSGNQKQYSLQVSVELKKKKEFIDFKKRLHQFKLEASTKIHQKLFFSNRSHLIQLVDTINIKHSKKQMETSIEQMSDRENQDLFDLNICESETSLTQIEDPVNQQQASLETTLNLDPILLRKMHDLQL